MQLESLSWFPGHMTKTRRMVASEIGSMDAVCEIIDARIPRASRNPDLDELTAGKPRIVVLNRVDQADPKATKQWAAWFRAQGYAVLEVDAKSGAGVKQFAPAVRVTIGESIGARPGENLQGRIVAALRKLGADCVMDTRWSADVTIMEEGTELLERLLRQKEEGTLHGHPDTMFTSCCPGWINHIEKNCPDMIPHISSTRSPQAIFGALAKTWLPKTLGIPAERIRSISIMPCTAKKDEAARELLKHGGEQDVDLVLTVQEFAAMLDRRGIDLMSLVPAEFDSPFMSEGSGAAQLFATTGGVMEAALRTVSALAGGPDLGRIAFEPVRGLATFKEAEVETEAFGKLRIAVVHGMRAADEVIRLVREGRSPYHFVEVMACPGGCVGGGGTVRGIVWRSTLDRRQNAVYSTDASMKLRTAHENEDVVRLYRDFLGEPGSPLAHELLHCEYRECERRSEKPDYRTIESAVELASV